MLPIKKETRLVSIIETKSYLIKIPSFKIPVTYIKWMGILFLSLCLFQVLSSLKNPVKIVPAQPTQPIFKAEFKNKTIIEILKIPKRNKYLAIESIKPIKTIPITSIITNQNVLDLICYNKFLERAFEAQQYSGLYVATIIAQKGVESGWNNSNLCKKTKNYGNIKCKCNWSKSLRRQHTYQNVCVQAWDKIEKSKHWYVRLNTNWEGWNLYKKLIYKVYKKATLQKTIYDQLVWLKKGGYASDKYYVQKLWKVIQTSNLLKLQEVIDSGFTITTSDGKYILLEQ